MTRTKLWILILSCLLFTAVGQASPACTTNTFAFYEANPCSIGIVNFDFSAAGAYTFTGDDFNPGAADVTVTPLGGPNPTAGTQVGFTFSNAGYVTTNTNPFGNATPSTPPTCCATGSDGDPGGTGWVATNPDNSGNNTADLNLTFGASINGIANPTMMLNSTTAGLNMFILTPDGGGTQVTLGETVTNSTTNDQTAYLAINGYASDSADSIANGGSALSSTTFFSELTQSLSVNKDVGINVLFPNTTPNSAAVNSLTETFTFVDVTVPEPGTFVLFGLAAVLFVAYRLKKAVFGFLALAIALVVCAPSAKATPLCTSVTQTMITFENLGSGGCTIGADLFSNFTYTVTNQSGNASVNTASQQGTATFTVNATSVAGAVGFRFQPTVNTNGGAGTDGKITITVSFDVLLGETLQTPGFAVSDSTTVNGSGTFAKSGFASAVTVTNTAGPTTVGTVTLAANGQPNSPGNCCGAVASGTTLLVTDVFNLDAPTGSSGNTTHISNFTDTLDENVGLPEPSAVVLLGSGMLGLVLFGRKKAASRG